MLWQALHALLVVMILCLLQKPFFYLPEQEGFSRNIAFIQKADFDKLITKPLYLVQELRYLAVYPLWQVHGFASAPLLNALFIVGLLWPLVRLPLAGKSHASPWRVIFFYLPCALSLRSVMVTAGIGFLLLLFSSSRRSRLMFAVSASCAILSSASVLLWLIASAMNAKHVRRLGIAGLAVVLLMVFSFSTSIMHKLDFFHGKVVTFEQQAGSPIQAKTIIKNRNFEDPVKKLLTKVLGEGNDPETRGLAIKSLFFTAAIIDRNTIIISLAVENYKRAVEYILLFALYLYCLRLSLCGGNFEKMMFVFFMLGFPLFFMEGLGVLSMLSPIILFLTERERTDRPWRTGYRWATLRPGLVRDY